MKKIEWWVQNGPIAKNEVLPKTTLFFWKFCLSLRTSYKELIWWTNDQNALIPTFCTLQHRCFASIASENPFHSALWLLIIDPVLMIDKLITDLNNLIEQISWLLHLHYVITTLEFQNNKLIWICDKIWFFLIKFEENNIVWPLEICKTYEHGDMWKSVLRVFDSTTSKQGVIYLSRWMLHKIWYILLHFWKNHVSCNFMHNFPPAINENFKSVFLFI